MPATLVDHREPVHRRRAAQGHRRLGGAGGRRHRPRAARRRAAARVVRLVVGVHGERALRRWPRVLLGIRYVPESRDPSPGSFDRGRRRALDRRLRPAGLRDHRGARTTAGSRPRPRRRSPPPWCCWPASCGWEPRIDRADARPRVLPQRQLQRGHGGGQRRLLRAARSGLRAHPVPAVRPRLQRHRGRRRDEPDGARPDARRRLVEQGRRAARRGPGRGRRADRPRRSCWRSTSCGRATTGRALVAPGSSASPWRWRWVMAPATDAVVGAVPAARSGVASATNTVARMVSGALGVAILGSIVSSLYRDDVDGSLGGLPPHAQAAGLRLDRRGERDRARAPAARRDGAARRRPATPSPPRWPTASWSEQAWRASPPCWWPGSCRAASGQPPSRRARRSLPDAVGGSGHAGGRS